MIFLALQLTILVCAANCFVEYERLHPGFLTRFANPRYEQLGVSTKRVAKMAHCTLFNRTETFEVESDTRFVKLTVVPHLDELNSRLLENVTFVEQLVLRGNSLRSIEDGAFLRMRGLRFLDLSHNRLARVSNATFRGLFATEGGGGNVLDLSSNALSEFPEDAFDAAGRQHLHALLLNDNKLTAVYYASFQVQLSGNAIREADFARMRGSVRLDGNGIDAVEGLNADIEQLDLSRNHVRRLRRMARCSPHCSTTRLALASNKIGSIAEDAFAGMVNLKELQLQDNELTSVGARTFAVSGSLRSLDLSGNYLKLVANVSLAGGATRLALRSNLAVSVDGLRSNASRLELDGNAISRLPPSAFAECPNLVALVLSRNRLTDVRPGSFDGAGGLAELLLERNELRAVRSGAFRALRRLRVLVLSRNGIERVEEGAFADLAALKELDLSGNSLTEYHAFALPPGVTCRLSDNRASRADFGPLAGRVFLDGNGIEEIGAGVVGPNVTLLSLRRNRVKRLRPGAFRRAARLERLDLAGNEISAIDRDAFGRLRALRYLRLNGNALETATPFMFDGLDRLRSLELKRNRISSIADEAFGNLDELGYLSLEGNALTRVTRAMWTGAAGLCVLDLSRNRIRTVEADAFQDAPGLGYVLLSGNEIARLDLQMFGRSATYAEADGNPIAELVPTYRDRPIVVYLGKTLVRNMAAASRLLRDGNIVPCYVKETPVGDRETCHRLISDVYMSVYLW